MRGFFIPAWWQLSVADVATVNADFDLAIVDRSYSVPAITKPMLITGPGFLLSNPWDYRAPFEESWFLHSAEPGTDQNRLEYSPNSGMYYMDVGSAGWRARVVADWAALLAANPTVDGIYIDGPGTPTAYVAANLDDAFPHYTAAQFEAACLAFLAAIKAGIPTGKLIILNTALYKPFVMVTDGSLYEDFVHAVWDANGTLQSKADWLTGIETIADGDYDDKYMLAYSATSEATLPSMVEYCYASFLLAYDANAKAHFYWASAAEGGFLTLFWFPVYEMELGLPLGPYYIWNGLYRRDFADGMVLVNSNDTGDAITVTLENNYIDSGGFVINSITLDNKAGAVLELYDSTLPSTALCTEEDAKDYLKLNALTLAERRFLARMIDAASGWIERLCNRVFTSQNYTLALDGNARRVLYPKDDFGRPLCPITALTSLKVDDVSVDIADTTKVLLYGNAGYVRLVDGSVFTRGYQNIDLVCTAGFVTLPPIIVQACCELVAQKWYLRDKQQQNVASLSEMGSTVTFTKDMMPKETLEALLLYRKLSV